MLKLSIHMDIELLCYGIEIRTPCYYFSLYLSIFLSFIAKFVSLFSPELYKLESSNILYVCRISDCIVGLSSRSWLLFFYFDPFFFLSPNYK